MTGVDYSPTFTGLKSSWSSTSLPTRAYDIEDLFSNWSRNSLNAIMLKFQAFYYLITVITFYKCGTL